MCLRRSCAELFIQHLFLPPSGSGSAISGLVRHRRMPAGKKMKARHIVYPLHCDCFWKTEAPLLCRFPRLTCFVPLREPLGEWRLMWCLRSLKRSAFSISLNWSAPSPSFSPASHTLSLSFFAFFSEIFQGYQTAHTHNWNQVSSVNIFSGDLTVCRLILLIIPETPSEANCHPAFLSSPTWQDFCALFVFPFFVCPCYNLQFSPCA